MFTLGSALLVLILLIGFIKNRTYEKNFMYLVKVLILFSVYIQMGYFINIGGNQFEYGEFLTVVVLIFSLPLIFKLKLKFSSIILSVGLLLSITISYMFIVFAIHPVQVLPIGGSWDLVAWGSQHLEDASFSSSHIMRFVRMVLFLMLYSLLDTTLLKNEKNTEEIKKFVVNSGLFMIGICIIEQLTKVVGSTLFINLTSQIFGVADSQVIVNFERGGVFALQGLTFEPSALAFSFIPAVFILLTSPNFTEKKRFYSLMAFLYVIIGSGSFGGFALSGLFLFVYIFSNRKKIVKKVLLLLVGFMAVGVLLAVIPTLTNLFMYYQERAFSLLNNGQVGSETARIISVQSAMDNFMSNPFFGVGLGSTDVHGFLPTMVSSLGIVGSILWFVTMLNGYHQSKIINVKLLIITLPFLYLTGSLRTIYSIHMILLFLFVFRKYKNNIQHVKQNLNQVLRAS